MKKLSLEQMEVVKGGDYCATLSYWINVDGSGFQGDWQILYTFYFKYC
jgi:hypothetical protein